MSNNSTSEKKVIRKAVPCICIAPHKHPAQDGGFTEVKVGATGTRVPDAFWKPVKNTTVKGDQ